MKFFFLNIFLLVFRAYTVMLAGTINIEGSAQGFKGESLSFFVYDDPFFNTITEITRTQVSDDGKFKLQFQSDETLCLYTQAGPYLPYLFVEPGNNYRIDLPEISMIPDDWKHNPYFQKVPLHIKNLSVDCHTCSKDESTELNQAIRQIDRDFNPFLDKQLLRYYLPKLSAEKRDSFIQVTFRHVMVSDQDYYNDYVKYKKALLEFNVSDHNLDSIIRQSILESKVNYHNPAYRELFLLIFDDYFTHLREKEGLSELFRIFAKFDYKSLKSTLQKVPVFQNESIFNMVYLHELYKAFYSNLYDKNLILALLMDLPTSFSPLEMKIAHTLYNQFTNLRTGYPSPSFRLQDISGDSLRSDSLKGDYVLIGFCDAQSKDCLKEFEYLKYLHDKHNDYLKIITVIPTSETHLPAILESNSSGWSVVSSPSGDSLMTRFNVRAMPVFYLIDRNGNLLLSPAMNPSEGLEQKLFTIMRDAGDFLRKPD